MSVLWEHASTLAWWMAAIGMCCITFGTMMVGLGPDDTRWGDEPERG